MSNRRWSDLPKELLDMIGERLETRIEIHRFRSICKSWRSIVPLLPYRFSVSPQLKLPPPINATAVLLPVTVYRLEDEPRNSACLIEVPQSTSGQIKIMPPLYSRPLRRIPPHSPCKTVNILSLRFVELCKGYRFEFKDKSSGVHVKKVVLMGESGILLIHGVGRLVFWRFGDEDWKVVGGEETRYDDIVVHKGQFYVVDSYGTISWVDINTMNLVQYSPPLFGFGQLKNLVVSDEQFFVVDTFLNEMQSPKPVDFEMNDLRVYKLDEEWGTWVDVKSLGDRVFVLGQVCFSVSSKDFPGCEKNCIYFSDSKMEDKLLSAEMKRYFPRVFELDGRRRVKTVDCVPSHRRLFSLSMSFPGAVSTLMP